ncbi:MAG: HAD family hydrolase [Patescibacteria group bacterium]
MIKGIIFDFVRTLYDPGEGRLFPGVLSFLEAYNKQGIKLGLVSFGSEEKQRLLQSLGLMSFLHWVRVVPEKTPAVFNEFKEKFCLLPEDIFVVGDRLSEEITVGQGLGMKTVWIQAEKTIPSEGTVKPDFIISSVTELTGLLEKLRQK